MSDNPESRDTGEGAFPHSSPLPHTVPTCLQKPPTKLSITFQYKILINWFGFAKKKNLNKIDNIKVLECLMHSSAPCFVDLCCHRLCLDRVFLNLVIGDTPRGSRLPTPVHFPARRTVAFSWPHSTNEKLRLCEAYWLSKMALLVRNL